MGQDEGLDRVRSDAEGLRTETHFLQPALVRPITNRLRVNTEQVARLRVGQQRRLLFEKLVQIHGRDGMPKPIPGAVPAVFYTRRASVVEVIDGDTISVDVDNGFHTRVRMACRIAKIDAPEKNTLAGKAAKLFLTNMLPAGTELVVESITMDKYGGRFDARVWKVETGENLADVMIRTGNARPWTMGKEKKPYAL